jgi:hypothetical protein
LPAAWLWRVFFFYLVYCCGLSRSSTCICKCSTKRMSSRQWYAGNIAFGLEDVFSASSRLSAISKPARQNLLGRTISHAFTHPCLFILPNSQRKGNSEISSAAIHICALSRDYPQNVIRRCAHLFQQTVSGAIERDPTTQTLRWQNQHSQNKLQLSPLVLRKLQQVFGLFVKQSLSQQQTTTLQSSLG